MEKPKTPYKGHMTFNKTVFKGQNIKGELITDKYKVVKKLGAGGYGTVYEIQDLKTKETYACKVLTKKDVDKRLIKERDILLKMDHPNIIKLYEIFEDKRFYYMVTEECKGGELLDRIISLLKQKQVYSELEAFKIFKQIMQAIYYCHKQKICHRDIKPENILFVGQGNAIKLIDFGLSKDLSKYEKGFRRMSKKVGTSYYVAPEVLQGDYAKKCDIWSAGVILYLLLSGTPPFNGKNDLEITQNVAKGEYSFPSKQWDKISDSAKDLIKKMLCPEPQRLHAKDIFQHEWFTICEEAEKKNDSSKFAPIELNVEGFEDYVNAIKIKKMALTYIADKLNEDEIQELKELFHQFDKDKNGTVSLAEFKEQLLKYHLKESEINRMFGLIDTDKNGVIDYTEFLASTLNIKNCIKEVYLEEAFMAMDINKDGTIDKSDLMEILKIEEGEKAASLLDKMIDQVDKNKDGKIDYQEFLDMMLNR